MKNYKIAILCLVICFCICCKNKTPKAAIVNLAPKKDSIILINKLAANQSTFVYDISGYDVAYFPTDFKANFPVKHTINTTGPVYLLAGEPGNTNTVFIVFPGEHIEVHTNAEHRAIFNTPNNPQRSNELSFFYDLYNKYPFPFTRQVKINTAADFKNADAVYAVWYLNAVNFLNTYNNNKSKTISPKFIQLAGKYLYYKRIYDLLRPFYNSPNAAAFTKGTAYDKFKECDSCLAMPHYLFALSCYNSVLTGKKTDGNFTAVFDTGKVHFTGATKRYLLYNLLATGMEANIGTPQFNQRIKWFFATYPNDTTSKILKDEYNNKMISVNSRSAFDENVLTASGRSVKWGDILAGNKGKVILVDFWARYCSPCVHEIPFSQSLEKQLSDKDITFIYVSFDASATTWKAGMDELNFKDRQNSFLIPLPSRSDINKYYNTREIPKYIIYDKHGKLVTKDGPRPSGPELKKLLSKLITNKI